MIPVLKDVLGLMRDATGCSPARAARARGLRLGGRSRAGPHRRRGLLPARVGGRAGRWPSRRCRQPHAAGCRAARPRVSPGDLGTIEDAQLCSTRAASSRPSRMRSTSNGVPALDVLAPVEKTRTSGSIRSGSRGSSNASPSVWETRAPLAARCGAGRLDRDYRRGLRRGESRVLVTTHAAFGHLADRYGLEELSLAGSSPEAEPSPQELERLIAGFGHPARRPSSPSRSSQIVSRRPSPARPVPRSRSSTRWKG